jgi:hypothetical protein
VLGLGYSVVVISYYGAYLAELNMIFICMEYTEKGSFDTIYKRIGAMKDIEKRRTPKELFVSFVCARRLFSRVILFMLLFC